MSSKKKKNKKIQKTIISLILVVIFTVIAYIQTQLLEKNKEQNNNNSTSAETIALENIPEYSGLPYVEINNNIPNFSEEDYTTEAFEKYSELDILKRYRVTYAKNCKKKMPAKGKKKEKIGTVKPSGWKNVKYAGLVDGNYLYNRCHLIGWQLAAENANAKNLITGTRYLNVEGMLPFENKVADYLHKKSTKNNHVLYRVTPIFKGSNLVASGVQMEAYSIEDKGKGVSFNVYAYNVQPGVIIDYKTGESKIENN